MTDFVALLSRISRHVFGATAIVCLCLFPTSAGAGNKGGSVQVPSQFHGGFSGHSAKGGHARRAYSRRHVGHYGNRHSGRKGGHYRKHSRNGSVSVSRSGVSLGVYGLQASGGPRYGKYGRHGHKGHKGHRGHRGHRGHAKHHRGHHGKHAYAKQHHGYPVYIHGNRRSLRRVYKPSTRYYTPTGALIISVGGSYSVEEGPRGSGYQSGNAPILEQGCEPGAYCSLRLGDDYAAPKIITRNQTGTPIN